ncbi:MAG: extracellular solute-binding protein [Treponema sp.]|jgi:ABC-type glycerol-3-phosphate transport system substrate-binding protein|nr:extracellular solute-binding protein [Treponema sp.]
MRKILKTGVIVILFAAITLPVCAGPGRDGGGSGEKITLTMSRWAGPHADDQKAVIRDYMAAHPNVNIVMDDTDNDNARQKQILSARSRVGTIDLFFVFNPWTDEYVRNGYLEPLDDHIKRTGLDMGIYNQAFIQQETFDGKLYAFPTRPEGMFMTFNGEQLRNDGKSIPKNTAELLELARFYKAKGTGIAMPARQGNASYEVYAALLYSAGGDFYDQNTGRITLDSEPAKFAINLYDQLTQNAITGSLTWHVDESNAAVREGKAPFGFTVPGLAMLDADPDQSVIVGKAVYAPVPGRNKVVTPLGFFGWAIAANSPHKAEAFDFLTWLVSPAIEKRQSLMNGQFSCVTANGNDSEIAAKYPFFGAVAESLQDIRTMPSSPNCVKMLERLMVGLSEVASTNVSPETVLARIQSEFASVDMRQ